MHFPQLQITTFFTLFGVDPVNSGLQLKFNTAVKLSAISCRKNLSLAPMNVFTDKAVIIITCPKRLAPYLEQEVKGVDRVGHEVGWMVWRNCHKNLSNPSKLYTLTAWLRPAALAR